MMKKIIEKEALSIIFLAIIIILICPCIMEIINLKNNLSIKSMIIEMKSECTEEPENFSIEKTLKILPEDIIAMIYSKGVKIYTTTEIGSYSEYGRVTSKYTHSSKKIIIQKVYSNEVVLLHEIGHAYSYNKFPFIKVSDTFRFRSIYNDEKDIIFPDGGKFEFSNFNVRYDYVKVNPEEYFAQCFSMYFLGLLPEDTETYKFLYNEFN